MNEVAPLPRAARLLEIDGLRGWAALAVVAFHEVQEVFGTVMPTVLTPSLRLFMDGPLAVYIFFVLSGDALSSAFVSRRDVGALDRVIAKRYFRLAVPVLLSVLLTYAVMELGLTYNHAAAGLVHREEWLGSFLSFQPSLFDAVRYALFEVFRGGPVANIYNTFLWTMPVELVGSLLVFSYLHIIHRLSRPIMATVFLFIVASLVSEFYHLFVFGILLGQLRACNALTWLRRSLLGRAGGLLLLLTAYGIEWYSVSYPVPGVADGRLSAMLEIMVRDHQKTVLAILLVFGIYINSPALRCFRSGVSRYLGRLSFGLYLVQFPVICSFESYLIVSYPNEVATPGFVFAAAGASLIVTIGLADLFSRVDDLALQGVSRWIRTLFLPGPAWTPSESRPTGRGGATVLPVVRPKLTASDELR